MIRIEAKTVKGRDLKPGDLFSMAPTEYWEDANRLTLEVEDGPDIPGTVGEKVFIRTNNPVSPGEEDMDITLVEIHYIQEEEEAPFPAARENWDGKGAHPFVSQGTESESNCGLCDLPEAEGNHKLEPRMANHPFVEQDGTEGTVTEFCDDCGLTMENGNHE